MKPMHERTDWVQLAYLLAIVAGSFVAGALSMWAAMHHG